ncbi:MAG: hypothetical protein M0004_16135 [Actinomycetota bacterium]|nr:hypothetical protein [Actinomycetota bacterium]
MIACVAIRPDGSIDTRWGRAERVAIADISDGAIRDWEELSVDWGALRDQGSNRRHHARIARFLRERNVQIIVAEHMGDGMLGMLETMGIAVRLDATGEARAAATAAVAASREVQP